MTLTFSFRQPNFVRARRRENGGQASMRDAFQIVVEDLIKRFTLPTGSFVALDRVSFQVREGEFFCIVGPSGCGKTTILRILAGLETKTGGDVAVHYHRDGRPRSAMVFQEQSVFPWMTVEANIAFGLRSQPLPAWTRRDIVRYYLDQVGLTPFARAYPHQLSGGMKQRVSIARAFATDPEILLMDEPFAALDEQNKLLLQQELLRIWDESRKTVVFITHSIDEAVALGDRVLVMTAPPGKVKQLVPVEFKRPRHIPELRRDARFGELVYDIWSALRDEVLHAREPRGGPRREESRR
jgi:NitT/TauT family transport system ATP-binding protein